MWNMFKVNNRSTRRCSGVSTVNFEYTYLIFWMALDMEIVVILSWKSSWKWRIHSRKFKTSLWITNHDPLSRTLIHIRNSRISWWNLKILVIFRFGMCWIHLTSCVRYCWSYQAVLETNGPETFWLYAEGTIGYQIWLTSSIVSVMRCL